MEGERRHPMIGVLWWARQIFLIVAGCFFLFFGIYVLIASYNLKNPFDFVMTFFASNLIILLSAVFILAFVIKAVKTFRAADERDETPPENT